MTKTIWPLRFSADPAAMIAFFAALGLNQTTSHEAQTYATFAGASGQLGVHDARTASPTAGRTVLNLLTDDVEAAADELRSEGLKVLVWDETYGKQGALTSPSGFVIGLNERTQEDLHGGYELHDQTVAAAMDVVAICAVTDLDREADFFARLGFAAGKPGKGYLPLTAGPGSGVIALRATAEEPPALAGQGQFGPPYPVSLGAETSEPFDALADRLRAGGYSAETIEDVSGAWVRVADPDGESVEVRPTR